MSASEMILQYGYRYCQWQCHRYIQSGHRWYFTSYYHPYRTDRYRTTTPLAKLDIHSSSGTNALHISGLTAGTDSTEQILTINRLTGMVDTTHLLHYIGESYGGGIIFYVYDNGLHGLIAASSDQVQAYNGIMVPIK